MNKQLTLILLLNLIFSFEIKAQKNPLIDSLENVLKTCKNDTDKVKTLNDLAWEYGLIDLKKAKKCCNSSIELATKSNYYKGRSSAYNTLGNIFSDEANNDEALKYYFLSINDKSKIHDEKGIATVYSNIGIIYKIKTEYEKALKYYMFSLQKRELLGDKKGIADCYNNIGNVYRLTSQYNEALVSFNKALEIRQLIGDKIGVAFVFNNIGGVYDDRADFVNALKYNYKSATLLEKEGDENSLVRVYNNIGILNLKLKNYQEALKYTSMSLKLAEEVGNKMYSINAYENMGTIYIGIKKFDIAKQNFEKGLALINDAGDKEQAVYLYGGLGTCYENNGDINGAEINYKKAVETAKEIGLTRDVARFSNTLADFYRKQNKNTLVEGLLNSSIEISKKKGLKNDLRKAYEIYAEFYHTNLNQLAKSIQYYKLYSELNDSLFSEDIAQKFAEQQTKYESEKKEAEIKILKQQEEIKSLRIQEQDILLQKRKYLLFTSLLIITSLIFIGYFYFSKQKIKSQQRQYLAVKESEEKERLRIAKDIHDDLGSGLSKIKFLAELVAGKSENNPEIKPSAKTISETATFLVGNMRDLIWALNPENSTLDSLIARIREYSSDYLSDFPIEFVIDVSDEVPNKEITKEAHRNIFFSVKESLQNIIKHANASFVKLTIDVTDNKFKMNISDNGKGLAEDRNNKGNGLKNIMQRASVINSLVEFNSEKGNGTAINIVVPIKNIEKI